MYIILRPKCWLVQSHKILLSMFIKLYVVLKVILWNELPWPDSYSQDFGAQTGQATSTALLIEPTSAKHFQFEFSTCSIGLRVILTRQVVFPSKTGRKTRNLHFGGTTFGSPFPNLALTSNIWLNLNYNTHNNNNDQHWWNAYYVLGTVIKSLRRQLI